MVWFICWDMKQRVQDDITIIFPATDDVRIFGEKIKISRISALPQAHIQPHLILNLLSKPDEGTLSDNDTTDREVAL